LVRVSADTTRSAIRQIISEYSIPAGTNNLWYTVGDVLAIASAGDAHRASGKTVAELAAEKNVPLQTLVDAAAAPDSDQLNAAVQAGPLTQAQADTLTQLTRSRIQAQLQTATSYGFGYSPGMMGGRGMMGEFGIGPGPRAP
jgi:hypothetical protein